MEKIKIYDDMFSQIDIKSIIDFFEKIEWEINKPQHIFTNTNDIPFYRKELKNYDFFSNYLKTKIEEKVNKKLKILRVYAVSQLFGQNSNYHTDYKDEHKYTFCLYITSTEYINNIFNLNHNHAWIESMNEGNFYIKIPNQTNIICIEPHTNRGIFFPSNYIHKGTGYDKYNSNLRICVSWKFEIDTN